ncbi:MAG TPA: glycosyltransferase [Planctomycetota bacterium]|nr:glycosyltransferase [Planctomycetota bacterium]
MELAPIPAPNLGVLVPCRNEERVIARKLTDLLAQRWPDAARAHRVVVVDDQSEDATAELARALAPRFAARGIALDVVPNRARPGKSGAIRCALEELGASVDVAVLTDADVVLAEGALTALARAFAREPRLGMASGSQRFVVAVEAGGRAPRGEASTAGLYDRITAWVRALESRAGRLFSVHGQLLALRTDLGIAPTAGFAADDLDLMLQVRLAGARVELARGARFLEVKTPPGPAREAQALRRARAYVQFLGHPRMGELARLGGPPARLQVALYRHAPLWAPRAWPLLVLATAACVWVLLLTLGAPAALGFLGGVVLTLQLGVGRRLTDLLDVIRRAELEEARASLADRWETPRA